MASGRKASCWALSSFVTSLPTSPLRNMSSTLSCASASPFSSVSVTALSSCRTSLTALVASSAVMRETLTPLMSVMLAKRSFCSMSAAKAATAKMIARISSVRRNLSQPGVRRRFLSASGSHPGSHSRSLSLEDANSFSSSPSQLSCSVPVSTCSSSHSSFRAGLLEGAICLPPVLAMDKAPPYRYAQYMVPQIQKNASIKTIAGKNCVSRARNGPPFRAAR